MGRSLPELLTLEFDFCYYCHMQPSEFYNHYMPDIDWLYQLLVARKKKESEVFGQTNYI